MRRPLKFDHSVINGKQYSFPPRKLRHMGDPVLTPENTRDIWSRLTKVDGSVNEVKLTLVELQKTLEHFSGDFDRIERLITELEALLYGKGDSPSLAVISRLEHLERTEERRQGTMKWIWAVIGGLVVDALRRIFGFGA